MYNYSLKLNYRKEGETDTTFQKEFLEVLGIPVFEYENVKQKMDKLYQIHKEYFSGCVKLIQEKNKYPFALTDVMAFQILFSWYNFFETHRFLGILKENKKNVDPTNNDLLTHLQTTFE